MTNEKKELFATLGLIAEESVANESVNPNENIVELTASESVNTEIKELENIDSCYNEVEKASFESTISDLELLNKALVYRNIKASGNKEEVYLESLSSEFGISTEGIKEIAEKGLDAFKTVIDKVITALKRLFGMSQTQDKVVKSLIYKLNNAEKNGKFSIKEFGKVLGNEMILGGMMLYGYSDKDFPNNPEFSTIIDAANNAVSNFHKNKTDKDNVLSLLSGDLEHILQGVKSVNTASNKISEPDNFNYYDALIKLVACFKAYNVGKYIKEMISVLEDHKKTLDNGGKIEFDSKIDSKKLSKILKTINKIKDINSTNVRGLVKLCGQYLKSVKSETTDDNDKKTA